MITMTKNNANKTCTIRKWTSDGEVWLTYLNIEQVWPVRSAALKHVNEVLYKPFNDRARDARERYGFVN